MAVQIRLGAFFYAFHRGRGVSYAHERKMTTVGLEPTIFGSEDRRLIH